MASTPGQLVGRLRVKVIPDTSDFARDLREDLAKIRQRIGDMKIKVKSDLDSDSFHDANRRIKRILRDRTVNIRGRFTGVSGGGGARGFVTRPEVLILLLLAAAAAISPLVGGLVLAFGAIGALLPVAAAVILGLDGIKNAFADLGGPLTGAKDSLTDIMETVFKPLVTALSSDAVGGTLLRGLEAAGRALAPVVNVLTDVLVGATESGQLDRIFGQIEPIMASLAPIIGLVAQGFLDLLEFALPFVAPFLDEIRKAMEEAGPQFSGLAPLIELAVRDFTILSTFLIRNTPLIIASLLVLSRIAGAVFQFIASVIMSFYRAGVVAYEGTIDTWDAMVEAYNAGGNSVQGVLNAIVVAVVGFVRVVIATLGELVAGVINAFGRAIDYANDATASFTDATQSWPDAMRRASNGVRDWAEDIVSGIPRWMGQASTYMRGIANDMIDGFVERLEAGYARVQRTLGRLTDLIPSWKGPPEYDRRLLRPAADDIMGGFTDQLRANFGSVRSAFKDVPLDLDVSGAGTGIRQVFVVDPTSQRGYVEEVASAASRGANRALSLRMGRTM